MIWRWILYALLRRRAPQTVCSSCGAVWTASRRAAIRREFTCSGCQIEEECRS